MTAAAQSGTRVRFIQDAGKQVLLVDLSDQTEPHEILAEIRTARDLAARQPRGSLLTLTLVHGARHTPVVMDALKELALRNRPYVKAAAVVGMEGLHRVLYRAVTLFSNRKIEAFENAETALDWLCSQP